jgi:hypothetical protein
MDEWMDGWMDGCCSGSGAKLLCVIECLNDCSWGRIITQIHQSGCFIKEADDRHETLYPNQQSPSLFFQSLPEVRDLHEADP